jgi:hypothetical protein
MSRAIDIDNLELVLHHQQHDLTEKLLRAFARKLAPIISNLAIENCLGCRNGHLSQNHHQCIMMEREERLYRYFDVALERVSETKGTDSRTQSQSEVNETILSNNKNWKTVLSTEQRRMLKQEIFHLL